MCWLFGCGFMLGMIAGAVLVSALTGRRGARVAEPPLGIGDANQTAVQSSMDDVLQLATEALQRLVDEVDDYTATLVKQESVDGELGPVERMRIKVQCPHRGGDQQWGQPMRVYLRFEHPEAVAGREVLWAEDRRDGKLLVREAGLLGLVPVPLDPMGRLAMRGQRYPINDIGLSQLLKKLIERGQQDRDDPNVRVRIRRGVELDRRGCDLIEVRRREPGRGGDDFSRAEICFDTQRGVPLRYTAYGWPADDAPLLESYTYLDLRLNAGLSDEDFDEANPEYGFR